MALFKKKSNLNKFITPAFLKLIEKSPNINHSKWIEKALSSLIHITGEEIERLDWKILAGSLEDLEKGFLGFYPYRHIRKITIFGSARIAQDSEDYAFALEFARRISALGFMVLTGAGGGIMAAANEGAGANNSFGLNIQLPFEQQPNEFINNDPKLIRFKYFFTRKLFFLRESDAVALFPGGFGTQDEAFETLILCQTGKYGPAPLVLINRPHDDYWQDWQAYISKHLLGKGLINKEDLHLYTITDDLDEACKVITNFYRVYHSSRYVNDQFVMRLNCELSLEEVEKLNEEFNDILVTGKIEKSCALPEEKKDETTHLPRLVFHFNRRDIGRLYEMINYLNSTHFLPDCHPEYK